MKYVLTENVDFTIGMHSGLYGSFQRTVHLNDGTMLNNIKNPRPNTVVFLLKTGQLTPVLIVDGEYELNGRMTNEWKWIHINEDGSYGLIEEGKGNFFEACQWTHIERISTPVLLYKPNLPHLQA